jgi:hypothetical protein
MHTKFAVRHYAIVAFCAALSMLMVPAGANADTLAGLGRPSLTVLLTIEGSADEAALKEMKHELRSIMRDAGKEVDVRFRHDASSDEIFEEVVLVKLKGKCKIDRIYPYMDERGPLAFTHAVNGDILPFAEVECDRLSRSVSQALFGNERKDAGRLLGRAMGRVVAHELYHILGKTHEHNEDGSLATEKISAKRLISDERLGFDIKDIQRLNP